MKVGYAKIKHMCYLFAESN